MQHVILLVVMGCLVLSVSARPVTPMATRQLKHTGIETRAAGVLPRLAVVTTGGTIASVRQEDGTLVPAVNGELLLQAVPSLNGTVTISGIYAVAKIDSSSATPEFWRNVAAVVKARLEDCNVDAVLVLHGTDTLEQTAWFLQCIDGVGNQPKPVIVTGAMRGADAQAPDGPGNILASAVLAADPKSSGLGVMLVMNDQVFSSRYVTKLNANNNDAFGGSNGGGRIANVISGKVLQYSHPNGTLLCPGYPLPLPTDVIPDVPLQAAYPGVKSSILNYYASQGSAGVVINAFGTGNMGAVLGDAAALIANTTNFKVVVAKVPLDGTTDPVYGSPGSLGALVKFGVVHSMNMNAFQARIVLILALAENPDITPAELQAMYYKISYPYN